MIELLLGLYALAGFLSAALLFGIVWASLVALERWHRPKSNRTKL